MGTADAEILSTQRLQTRSLFKRCAFGRFYVPLMYVTSVGCC